MLSLPPPPPPGQWVARACPYNCSGRGVCNEGTGECLCVMGRQGAGCEKADPFPCNLDNGEQLVNRCAGSCNLETSKCTCGGGKYPERSMHKCVFKGMEKYITWMGPGWDYERFAESPRQLWSNAADAPAYVQRHPSFQSLLKPKGVAWCDAEPGGPEPVLARCKCNEGMTGPLCSTPVLHACLNQCNGRGRCVFGYCHCDASWYGVDCSLRRGAVAVVAPGKPTVDHSKEDVDYALGKQGGASSDGAGMGANGAATTAQASPLELPPPPPPPPPAPSKCAEAGLPPAVQLRDPTTRASGVPFPAIFVYELPIEYNVQLWTSKSKDEDCALRAYTSANTTDWKQHAFGMEVALHERLLHSRHRVADPELADFFYVPVWGGCWLSRFSRPTPRHHDLSSMARFDPAVKIPRSARASAVYKRAYEHIRTTYPFWNRTNGADHIWTFPHDEGACLAPKEIAPSILISHWGRLMLHPNNHTSTSTGQGWHVSPHYHQMYGATRCFEPGKDLLLPIYKSRNFVQTSPYVTGKHVPRTVLFNFRGNAHLNQPQYSLGLRQQLYTLLSTRDDRCVCADPGQSGRDTLGSKSLCKSGQDADGCLLVGGHSRDYISDLQKSVFCGVLPGNGWGHIEEPVIHGCIPVLVMPEIHVQMEGMLNLSKFAIRVERSELGGLADRLRAIPRARVAEMQAELAKVWERYTYSALFKREFAMQDRPSDATTRARVGAPPAIADQKSRVFAPMEHRLRGLDAVEALLEHLRLRRLQQLEQKAGCVPAGPVPTASAGGGVTVRRNHPVEAGTGARTATEAAASVVAWPGAPSPPVALVDHGPPAPTYPPVKFFVWTTGVQ